MTGTVSSSTRRRNIHAYNAQKGRRREQPLFRETALVLLCDILCRTLDERDHEAIKAWLQDRSAAEGGFLWLSGQLERRPNILERVIRDAIEAPQRKRRWLTQRITRTLQALYGMEA